MKLTKEEEKFIKDLLRVDWVATEAQRKALQFTKTDGLERVDKYLKERQYMADRIANKISNQTNLVNHEDK